MQKEKALRYLVDYLEEQNRQNLKAQELSEEVVEAHILINRENLYAQLSSTYDVFVASRVISPEETSETST